MDVNGGTPTLHTYQPYGQEITTATSCPTSQPEKLKFAAMERDSSTGNDYDHARFHLTGMARFLGVDPLGGTPAVPLSWNRYSYALSNPLIFLDPTGLDSCPDGDPSCASPADPSQSSTKGPTTAQPAPGAPRFTEYQQVDANFQMGWLEGWGGSESDGVKMAIGPVRPNNRPCDWIDKTFAAMSASADAMLPATISAAGGILNITGLPLGGEADLTANTDGSADLSVGGGIVVGGSVSGDNPTSSFGGYSDGGKTGATGFQFSLAIPISGGPGGITISGRFTMSGTSFSAAPGVVHGFSAAAVFGHRFRVRDAVPGGANPCH